MDQAAFDLLSLQVHRLSGIGLLTWRSRDEKGGDVGRA